MGTANANEPDEAQAVTIEERPMALRLVRQSSTFFRHTMSSTLGVDLAASYEPVAQVSPPDSVGANGEDDDDQRGGDDLGGPCTICMDRVSSAVRQPCPPHGAMVLGRGAR